MFRKLFLTAAVATLFGATADAQVIRKPTPRPAPPKPRPVNDDGGLPPENIPPQPDKAWRLGVDLTARGGGTCLVTRVYPGSPAANIGLKVGDVVSSINGQAADDPSAMRELVFANDQVEVCVRRNGANLIFDAEFETSPGIGAGGETVMLKQFVKSRMRSSNKR